MAARSSGNSGHGRCLSRVGAAMACVGVMASGAWAQLRVATWNVSNYPATLNRDPAFQTALYGSFQERRMAPDVLVGQEFLSEGGVDQFVAMLNTAAGSPGDWAAAPFIDGPDSDSALFYRTSRVHLLGVTVVLPGGNLSGNPRNVLRYEIRPVGYTSSATIVAVYSVHMISGSDGTAQARRLVEATGIRNDANALPAPWHIILAGDLNIQSSNQAAWQMLTGPQSNDRGRLFDPIATPGSWNNAAAFRFVHTQAPGGNPQQTGGMDDRFDVLLLSASLVDGQGFDYIGESLLPYSTTTWNDPNHSYRVWGNDGSFFDQSITIQGNQMVGAVIAQALYDTTVTDPPGGHLPVFLDLRLPARVGSPPEVDFGTVTQGTAAVATLPVHHAGDVTLWGVAGLDTLRYTLSASSGFWVQPGTFTAAPGTSPNQHVVAMDTGTPGQRSGTIIIASNDPDQPLREVRVRGTVLPACYANCDGSTLPPVLNVADFTCFLVRFAEGQTLPAAQQATHYANCDGSTLPPVLNVADFTCFLVRFAAGCP